MSWVESLFPIGVTIAGISLMGSIQGWFQQWYFGKPMQKVGKDQFCRDLLARDNRLWLAEAEAKKKGK
eukprot:CAMPEP_0184692122 /NCGR_PEP_ID=MMETSP0313-20130426/735_1 /TAXON_ID=2792 /ORGANISM="Porphyridium aerugineum, Strain SAG 1380-2" /LENGTH=67 /DNA_ID=CAMNT_0027149929 /DNA_START=88 /DNA_END=291 /DNA_ORIENTATION=+